MGGGGVAGTFSTVSLCGHMASHRARQAVITVIMKATDEQLVDDLNDVITSLQRQILRVMLKHMDELAEHIADEIDRHMKDEEKIKTIASDLKLSRSTVKRALHDLTEAGLIEIKPRYRDNGSSTSNLYSLKQS